jgi:hypothetical protein
MKGKATWKPMGLSAKKWHAAGHASGAASVGHPEFPPRRWRKRAKIAAQWPMEMEKGKPEAES